MKNLPVEFTNELVENDGSIPADYEIVTINTFPIDLDLLYYQDDPTLLEERLVNFEENPTRWIVRPWGSHFTCIHIEGSDK